MHESLRSPTRRGGDSNNVEIAPPCRLRWTKSRLAYGIMLPMDNIG